MKKEQLKQVIKEELQAMLNEMDMLPLPSGDELEGNKAIAAASDLEAAQIVLPELKDYIDYNFKATLEDAADAWLEAHGFDKPPLNVARDVQRDFLIRVGREAGLQ